MLRDNYKFSINIFSILIYPLGDSTYLDRHIVGFHKEGVSGLFKIIDIGDKYRSVIRTIYNNAPEKV